MSQHILQHSENGILTLTIHRPEFKNAITRLMYNELISALNFASSQGSIRVVIITGFGDIFTSGNDLTDFLQDPPTDTKSPIFQFLKTLAHFPKPVIAAVNGAAVGIGMSLLLHCDFVYASEGVLFQLPFVRLGLVPSGASTYLLPLKLGHIHAAKLLMLGGKFDAKEALSVGLLNELVPSDQLQAVSMRCALTLAALPPEAIRQTKELLKAPFKDEIDRVMFLEGELFMQRLSSSEGIEGMNAFLEERLPDFSQFS